MKQKQQAEVSSTQRSSEMFYPDAHVQQRNKTMGNAAAGQIESSGSSPIIQKSKSNIVAGAANNSFSMKDPNIFILATKISDTFEIGQIIRDCVEGKFKVESGHWFLEKNLDGLNIYTD